MLTSTLTDLARQCAAALRILVAFTVILGIAYPAVVWSAGRAFADRADGQPIRVDGQIVGSRLIGQQFEGDEWFHSRPSWGESDTERSHQPFLPNRTETANGLASGPSNLGPRSEELLTAIADRRTAVAQREGVSESEVPADAVTGSASGLDPHISPAYARLQSARVATANGLSVDTVSDLIAANTEGRFLGFAGELGINVLELNLAIQQARQ